jgi:5-methylcytosine-specific restriction endonuclease McrA
MNKPQQGLYSCYGSNQPQVLTGDSKMAENELTPEEQKLQEKRTAGRERMRRWIAKNREKFNERNRRYYHENKDKRKASTKKWVAKSKGKLADYMRKYRAANKERMKELDRKAYEKKRELHPERIRESNRKSAAKKRAEFEATATPEQKKELREKINARHTAWTERQGEERKEKVRKKNREYGKTEHGRLVRRICAARREALLYKAEGDFTEAEWLKILEDSGNKCTYCGKEFSKDCQATIDHMVPLSRGGSNYASNLTPACASCNTRKKNKTPEEYAVWKEKVERYKRQRTPG